MSSPFWRGVVKCAPIAVGAVPFGAAVGLAAVDLGMTPLHASAMSVIVFAGAAQLAMIELAKNGASPAVIVAVAVAINLRFAMYSAALAGWAKEVSLGRRVGLTYLLTDQAFAVTTEAQHASIDDDTNVQSPHALLKFYLGAALTLWVAWQGGTALGAWGGQSIPPEIGIEFVAPLAFVGLSASALRNRIHVATAASSLLTYGLLRDLPAGIPLILAAIVGVAVGSLVEAAVKKAGPSVRGAS